MSLILGMPPLSIHGMPNELQSNFSGPLLPCKIRCRAAAPRLQRPFPIDRCSRLQIALATITAPAKLAVACSELRVAGKNQTGESKNYPTQASCSPITLLSPLLLKPATKQLATRYFFASSHAFHSPHPRRCKCLDRHRAYANAFF